MSIATVVTRGFGTFGDAEKLPTRGYSIFITPPTVVVTDTRHIQQTDTSTLDIEQEHSGVLSIQRTVTHNREL